MSLAHDSCRLSAPRSLHCQRTVNHIALTVRCSGGVTRSFWVGAARFDWPDSRVSSIAHSLNRARRGFPPLKHLVFDAFWFLFALIEMGRFLGACCRSRP